jgi:hypothetical protein
VLPELLPPPPQPTVAPATITSSNAKTAAKRGRRARTFSNKNKNPAALKVPLAKIQYGPSGSLAGSARTDAAVVVMVSILVPELPLPFRLTVEFAAPFSVNEQPGICRSAGFVGITAHVRATVPLSPMEVTVSGLVADFPAAEMLMHVPVSWPKQLTVCSADGFMVNPSLFATVTLAVEVVDELR